MSLDLINHICNGVILAFCIWCVLDVRVHTGLSGTLALSTVGLCSFLNITTPNWFGLIPAQYATMLNVSLASAAILFWVKWRDPRKRAKRRIFGERRNK